MIGTSNVASDAMPCRITEDDQSSPALASGTAGLR